MADTHQTAAAVKAEGSGGNGEIPVAEARWFRGKLEGHYVGTSGGKSVVSSVASAERFKLRIYRALIRDIEVLEAEETSAPPGECFYQASIDDTRLLGIRPRSCFEGPVYDVTVSGMTVTHSTRRGARTYGRVVGEVHGRFLLPEAAPAERVPVQETEAGAAVGRPGEAEQTLADVTAGPAEKVAPGELEPLHPPATPSEREQRHPAKVPLALLAAVVAVALGLSVGSVPAVLWLVVLVPVAVIRFMLEDMVEIGDGQRVVGAILVLTQFACLGLIAYDWWSGGCKSVPLLPTIGVGVSVLVASFLPSAAALLGTGAGMALLLFSFFSNIAGAPCEAPGAEAPSLPATERPTVEDPGIPRTNADGTWPRRPDR